MEWVDGSNGLFMSLHLQGLWGGGGTWPVSALQVLLTCAARSNTLPT